MPPTSSADAGSPSAHRGLWWALALAIGLAFVTIGSHSLWSPDEPTGAAVGKHMLTSGDWVLTSLGGTPFLEKPPLYWWTQAAAFSLFGVSDAVARLPSAVFFSLTLLVAFAIGRHLGGTRRGLLAALVLATIGGFAEEMGRVLVDVALVFFVAVAHLGWVRLATATTRGERWRAALLIAVATPLAFLAKGVIGPALAVGPAAIWLTVCEPRRAWERLAPVAALGVPLFALLVVPWALALLARGGEAALRECLVNNTLGRLAGEGATTGYGHRRGAFYYLLQGPVVLLPWAFALPAMLRPRVLRQSDARQRLLLAIGAVGLLALSAATTKRTLYLVPLMPVVAVAIATWLDGLAGPPERSSPNRGTPDRGSPDRAGDAWDHRCLALVRGLALVLLGVLGVAYPVAWLGARWLPVREPLSVLLGVTPAWAGFAFSLVTLALVAFFWRRQRATAGTYGDPAVLAVVLPLLLAFGAWETAVKAAMDPVKSLHQTTAAIARLLPGPGPVPAYIPLGQQGERLVAIVDYDLGRRVDNLARAPDADLAAVDAYLADSSRRLLLAASTFRRLPPATRNRLALLHDETGRTSAEYVIVGGLGPGLDPGLGPGLDTPATRP
jgi:4-amino-4-deoxy-L-arabinose transferase-like glycosyltransferase